MIPITPELIRAFMFMTWLYAWIGYQMTKLCEAAFKLILKMPDHWFSLSWKAPMNTEGQQIHILAAHNGREFITNRLKLFLRFYWEENTFVDKNGFDFTKLQDLLECSMIYVCYLLVQKKDSNIKPQEFMNQTRQFLLEMRDGRCVKTQGDTVEKCLFNYVHFDNQMY